MANESGSGSISGMPPGDVLTGVAYWLEAIREIIAQQPPEQALLGSFNLREIDGPAPFVCGKIGPTPLHSEDCEIKVPGEGVVVRLKEDLEPILGALRTICDDLVTQLGGPTS